MLVRVGTLDQQGHDIAISWRSRLIPGACRGMIIMVLQVRLLGWQEHDIAISCSPRSLRCVLWISSLQVHFWGRQGHDIAISLSCKCMFWAVRNMKLQYRAPPGLFFGSAAARYCGTMLLQVHFWHLIAISWSCKCFFGLAGV